MTDDTPLAPTPRPFLRRLPEWSVVILCLFLFFWRLGGVPLFDLDEALYVTSSRQMVLSGDYVTPRLNSRPLDRPTEQVAPFFEKPILVYWACAASLRAFGMSEGAARLPVALAALLTTGLVAFAGTRWFGRRAGLLAAVVYATAPMTLVDARQMTTDGLLVLWFTIALLTFFELHSHHALRRQFLTYALFPHRLSRIPLLLTLVFWLACGMAVLTKGAVGLLIPFLVISAYLLFDRLAALAGWGDGQGLRFRIAGKVRSLAHWAAGLRALRPLLGLLVVVVVAAPWHLAIWRTKDRDAEGRTWTQEYIVRQHIGRFKGLDTVHNAPLPSYFVYFLFGFFPWACFAPAAFRRSPPAIPDAAPPRLPQRKILGFRLQVSTPEALLEEGLSARTSHIVATTDFLRVWFWTIFLFFTIGAAKLPTYIVPCYPAAALLTSLWLDRALREQRRALQGGTLAAAITAGILVVGGLLAPHLVPPDRPIPAEMAAAIRHITFLLLIGCGSAWACLRWRGQEERGRKAGIGILVATMVGLIALGTSEGYRVAERYVLGPYQHAAAAAQKDAAAGTPVIFYHIIPRRPSMLYYGGYSPLERKEEPLLPFLKQQLAAPTFTVDVVTAGDVYDGEVQQELAHSPDVTATLIDREGTERGGWVLVRFRKK
jgi:4-amino-4-deoxy-L-arabinose transferase-like glycosyltransferase